MPYSIFTANGTQLSIPESTIDTTYYNPNANGAGKGVGIQLLGRNVVNYGPAVAQNFLQLMGNFAGPTPPVDGRCIMGQLWFNTTELDMYVRINNNTTGGLANWKKLCSGGTVDPGPGGPNPGGPNPGTPIKGEVLYDGAGVLIGYMAAAVPVDADAGVYIELLDGAGVKIPGAILSPSIGATVAARVGMSLVLSEVSGALIGYAFP